jgi:hypothetical protein
MFMLLFLSLVPRRQIVAAGHTPWPGYICHRENRASTPLTLAEPFPAQIALIRFLLLKGCQRENANRQD